MAFPFLPGNQGATEERLRYLYQLRNEIQQRSLPNNNLQSQACADIAQADDRVPANIDDENEEQNAEQTRRKMKHAAFSLLKPLRKSSLERLSAALSLHQAKSLPEGSERSGYAMASHHPVSATGPVARSVAIWNGSDTTFVRSFADGYFLGSPERKHSGQKPTSNRNSVG